MTVQMLPSLKWPQRVETGPTQFGDDWPGVFIRGDNALYISMHLKRLREAIPDEVKQECFVEAISLNNIIDLLDSCRA